jgi:hypothetical protein
LAARLLHHRLQGFRRAANDANVCLGGRQRQRDGSTHAGSASGDDRRPTFQTIHVPVARYSFRMMLVFGPNNHRMDLLFSGGFANAES